MHYEIMKHHSRHTVTSGKLIALPGDGVYQKKSKAIYTHPVSVSLTTINFSFTSILGNEALFYIVHIYFVQKISGDQTQL